MNLSLLARMPGARPVVQFELHFAFRAPARVLDWKSIRKKLETEAAVPITAARSLAAVGRKLSVAVRTLRSKEPKLCRTISLHFLQRRSEESAQKTEELRKEIVSACEALRGHGDRIVFATVSAHLKLPGLFSRPIARRIFAETLGLDYQNWPKTVTVPGRQRTFVGR